MATAGLQTAHTPQGDKDSVARTAPGYERMRVDWQLIDALKSGTPGMRALAHATMGDDPDDYLPRLPAEGQDAYRRRVAMSYLHPGFNKAVQRVASKPFGKPVQVLGQEQLDERLQALIFDTDGQGKSLTQLAREMMQDGLERGLMHLISDLPNVRPVERRDQERGLRPRLLRLCPTRLIDWPHDIDARGALKLNEIRFREHTFEKDGKWGVREVPRIRIWREGGWELWKQVKDGDNEKWTREGGTTWSYKDGIPITTGYFSQSGFMEATSPFRDLAWLNLAHWQSSSRQRYYLDFARLAFLWARGVPKDVLKKGLIISPNKLAGTENPQGFIDVVEHAGAAIAAGERDLADLERRMDEMGMKPLATKGGTPTAAARWLDEASVLNDAMGYVQEVESVLEQGFKQAAKWINVELSDDFAVKIPGDVTMRRSAADVPQLITLHQMHVLDQESLLVELKERGVLRDELTVEDVMKRSAEERKAMLEMLPVNGSIGADDDDPAGEEAA